MGERRKRRRQIKAEVGGNINERERCSTKRTPKAERSGTSWQATPNGWWRLGSAGHNLKSEGPISRVHTRILICQTIEGGGLSFVSVTDAVYHPRVKGNDIYYNKELDTQRIHT